MTDLQRPSNLVDATYTRWNPEDAEGRMWRAYADYDGQPITREQLERDHGPLRRIGWASDAEEDALRAAVEAAGPNALTVTARAIQDAAEAIMLGGDMVDPGKAMTAGRRGSRESASLRSLIWADRVNTGRVAVPAIIADTIVAWVTGGADGTGAYVELGEGLPFMLRDVFARIGLPNLRTGMLKRAGVAFDDPGMGTPAWLLEPVDGYFDWVSSVQKASA